MATLTQEEILRLHTIAVVGFSTDPSRPAHYVPAFLHGHGYRIIPVNPAVTEAWGERAYPALPDVPDPVDIVLVFRRPEFVPAVVRDALTLPHRPAVIWLQSGITSPEAHALADAAGVTFVQDRCLMVVVRQHEGQ